MSKRKYRMGRQIISFNSMDYYLEKDNFIYLNNRIQHNGFVRSMRYGTLSGFLRKGAVHRAIKIKEGE